MEHKEPINPQNNTTSALPTEHYLPDELWAHILNFLLSTQEKIKASGINRQIRNVALNMFFKDPNRKNFLPRSPVADYSQKMIATKEFSVLQASTDSAFRLSDIPAIRIQEKTFGKYLFCWQENPLGLQVSDIEKATHQIGHLGKSVEDGVIKMIALTPNHEYALLIIDTPTPPLKDTILLFNIKNLQLMKSGRFGMQITQFNIPDKNILMPDLKHMLWCREGNTSIEISIVDIAGNTTAKKEIALAKSRDDMGNENAEYLRSINVAQNGEYILATIHQRDKNFNNAVAAKLIIFNKNLEELDIIALNHNDKIFCAGNSSKVLHMQYQQSRTPLSHSALGETRSSAPIFQELKIHDLCAKETVSVKAEALPKNFYPELCATKGKYLIFVGTTAIIPETITRDTRITPTGEYVRAMPENPLPRACVVYDRIEKLCQMQELPDSGEGWEHIFLTDAGQVCLVNHAIGQNAETGLQFYIVEFPTIDLQNQKEETSEKTQEEEEAEKAAQQQQQRSPRNG